LPWSPPGRCSSFPSPQGTHTENGLAGFAKILCSGVFISEREPEDVARGSAYFFMPRAEQDQVKWTVDREARSARASFGAITREARYYGDQGCIIDRAPARHPLHAGAGATTLPDAMAQDWPMGDRLPDRAAAGRLDRAKLEAAVDAALPMPTPAMTAAFLVVHKGRIVAERYAPGVTKDTQLESWSMGKSLTATLFACS
jgi:hypothetical protein